MNMKSNGSGNGFDIISIEKDADGIPTQIDLFEAKTLDAANNNRVVLKNTANDGEQLSDTWIDAKIQEMRNSSNSDIANMGQVLKDYTDAGGTFGKYITTIDRKLGQPIILKY